MAVLTAVGIVLWLIALCAFDIRRRRLPNVLTLPGAVVILVGAALAGEGVAAAAGGVALFGCYAAVHLAAPASLGAGDVKLALGVGALTGAFGADAWLLGALGASLLTGLLGLVAVMRGDRGTLPHGLSMCTAAAVAVSGAALGSPAGW
ncbi:A24 family peptidase [Mycolicibacterium iranicum]|nr:A24 family peptidase [Mycolicibacterium iranicum]